MHYDKLFFAKEGFLPRPIQLVFLSHRLRCNISAFAVATNSVFSLPFPFRRVLPSCVNCAEPQKMINYIMITKPLNLSYICCALVLALTPTAQAQTQASTTFEELADPNPKNTSSWEQLRDNTGSGFVSVNQHFHRSSAPQQNQLSTTWKAKGWRGERVHTQAIVYTKNELADVRLEVSDLKGTGNYRISKSNIKANFLRYAMTDHVDKLTEACRIPKGLEISLRADMIDNLASFSLDDSTSRPIWLQVDIPQDTEPGNYSGTLTIKSKRYTAAHAFSIEVLAHKLPPAKDWTFHLDLWQNPYSDARVHNVELWSDAHFAVMRDVYKMLADAGQKVITATLIDDPWQSQTYDVYGGMIKWIKKTDGSWDYDYSIFDKWVEFMMDLGIDEQINTYSMIPWTLKFQYYDEESGTYTYFEAQPDSPAYAAYWGGMLKDFAAHLKQKGWFAKTTIAMDERPEKDMLAAINVIRTADPHFKISMAGAYHEDIHDYLFDYSVASMHDNISEAIMQYRKQKGYITKFYTSCTEIFPNAYSSSEYAELTWMAWHALYKDYDGYLRWDYNNWNKDPRTDTRFNHLPAGDTYFVYPDAKSSVRFERLREGIQDFEKVHILRKKLQEKGDSNALARLDAATALFNIKALNGKNAHEFVDQAKTVLNSF